MQVMDTLLANTRGATQGKVKSPGSIRKTGKAG